MKVAVYSTKKEEQALLRKANAGRHELLFIEEELSQETALLAHACRAVAITANDDAGAEVLKSLAGLHIKYIVIRAYGYDNVNLQVADDLLIHVANVPEYSLYSIEDSTVYNLNCFEKGERSKNELWHSLCRHCENKMEYCC